MYDVIVVGAGVQGSSTAYQLTKKGKSVLLLDQFPLPTPRGSSNGHTRITRKAYGANRFYTEMAEDSFKMIAQLETECGEQLFVNSGFYMISDKNDEMLKDTEECFKASGSPYEIFGIDEQRRRYPNLVYPENYAFLFDGSGGILYADKILQAYHTQIRSHGGVIRDNESVIEITPGAEVTVKTSRGVYRARNVVLTLGPWAVKLLPRLGLRLPLQVQKIPVFYWKEKHPGTFDNFRAFASRDKDAIYGIAANDYPGLVKVCHHHGPAVDDPDDVNSVDSQWVLNKMMMYVAEHFPSLEPRPSVTETCMYTRTPDDNFILDCHPKWKNVVIGAGFSGHGFKLAPVVGKILADMATGTNPEYDVRHFSISRFSSKL